MGFDTTRYLDWYMPRVRGLDGSINLHASGVPPLDLLPILASPPEGSPWSWAGAFEAALARWLGLAAEEVLYTPGATGGTLLTLLALARPGQGFLVEKPIYEPMLRQAERLGQVARLSRSWESRWSLDLLAAERALDPSVGVVLITEPHNPSGVFAPRDQVLELAHLCEARGAWLLVNEVYRGFSERESLHGQAPNLLVVSSLSKLFGAYAARLGWISGPPEVIARLRHAHLSFGMSGAPGAGVGLALMGQADALVAEARRRSAGAHLVDAWVKETPKVAWARPEGPGYGLLVLVGDIDDVALAEGLHQRHGVLLVPGTLFEQPGSLRISWLQASHAELDAGLAKVTEALALTDALAMDAS